MGYRRGMSSERTRIGIIFAVVAIVVGGGAFYFFKIYQPRHAMEGAQDEIGRASCRERVLRLV